ncbi:disulfide bond formation protein B [Brucellaceae bacterium C25G]
MGISLKALNHPVDKIQTATAAILFIGMAGTVGTALAFEHWGGFMPCKLCLEQRTPYYIGVPLMAAAFVFAKAKWSPLVTRLLLLIGALLMSYGLILAVYHTGVELKYWPGPADCSAASMSITTQAGNLLSNLNSIRPPACDEAAGRFLGLSFPGWNILASLLFAAIAFFGAFSSRKH